MSIVETERVLVVPTEVFHALGHFQGFTTDVDKYLTKLLDPSHTSYRPRSEMEQDPSFKQLIPYVIFRWTEPEGTVRLFQYTRGKGQGEQRLHSKRSIGIGGHISTVDESGAGSVYEEGMRRELAEEVIIETEYKERVMGMINDDETDVGRVHLGVVHIFDVDTPTVRPREAEISQAGFSPVAELKQCLDQMESWSRICMEALFV
ncbi:MAG: phosphoesterase [Pirellulaceae bacterium]|nr:phosphoesterase [Planctomycetales bacterium]